MSKESIKWLNTMVLRGFTDKRGPAWHYMKSAQGVEANHYPGAIPVADVYRRLFGWEGTPREVLYRATDPNYQHLTTREVPDPMSTDPDAVTSIEVIDESVPRGWVRAVENTAWARDDGDGLLGIHSADYVGHQYREWLVRNVETVLSESVQIASAGLLKGGAQAWVQVEMPDTVEMAGGVKVRPFLMATTSFDGSIATTYKTGATDVVCDNTRHAFLSEAGESYRVKHTSRSGLKVAEARDALGILYRVTDAFAAEVEALLALDVSDKQWSAFLDAHAPVADPKTGDAYTGRTLTIATGKRETLTEMWNTDIRVQPWRGTAYGVVQAVNTFVHHKGIIRGASRPERNYDRAIRGQNAVTDMETVGQLFPVLGVDLKDFRRTLAGAAV